MDNTIMLRELICEIGHRLYVKSYISGTGGNISIRESENRVLITPSMRNKGFLQPAEIAVMDLAGNDLSEGIIASSEKRVHLVFYQNLPGVHAVIHAHPPAATAYAMVGKEIHCVYSPETMVFLGEKVPLVPYETPSSEALPENFKPFIHPRIRAYLMQNHGAVTIAGDLEEAYNNMETLELFARTMVYAEILGSPGKIPPEKLEQLKRTFNLF